MHETPAGYEIGPAHRDELTELPRIEIAAAEMFPPEYLAPALGKDTDPLSLFELAFEEGRLWVARTVRPVIPVGFAVAIVLDGSAHLQEMDVLPDHGRRGLGRALVLQVVEWARATGFASLTLTTFRDLDWNEPFYASLGFSEVAGPDLGKQLRETLADEAEEGLDPRKRLAMRLDLRGD